ncbi:MAG: S8 family serine peptidase, partial [Pirellulales bacterium]
PNRYKTANFRARFRLQSDNIITKNGVCIEEVGVGSGTGSDRYAYFFGTSMATPHVTGLYALLASQSPSSTVSDLKAAILDNVDPLTALSGKVVTGGRINADKAIQGLGGGGGGGGGPGMDLLDPTPGQAGTTNTFALTGADPGATLSLYRSASTGSTSVGACTVDLNNARLTQTATADGSGNASFQVVIPSGAAGKTYHFQAVDDTSCAVSDIVSPTF